MKTGNAKHGEYRKFGSIRILRDGRVRFSPWTLPGLPLLDFTVVHDSARAGPDYTIHASLTGQSVFLVYVARHRVESTCFGFGLSPDALRQAVSVLRDAKNGIEQWIIPGLESTQRTLSGMTQNPNPELLTVIPALLRSVRMLPVAPQWRKRLRFLEQWERANAGNSKQGNRKRAVTAAR